MNIEVVESDKKTGEIINTIYLNDVLPEDTLEDREHERKIMMESMDSVNIFHRVWIDMKSFFSRCFCCRSVGEEQSRENEISDAPEELPYAEVEEIVNLSGKKHWIDSLDKITQF